MTIQIRTDEGEIITYDNRDPKADGGKIGYGYVTTNPDGTVRSCTDGQQSKKQTAKELREFARRFLK